jgi:hypothetical protein
MQSISIDKYFITIFKNILNNYSKNNMGFEIDLSE